MLERISIADDSSRGIAQHFRSEVELELASNRSMPSIGSEARSKIGASIRNYNLGYLTSQRHDESDLSVFFDDLEDQFEFASQPGTKKLRAGARDL